MSRQPACGLAARLLSGVSVDGKPDQVAQSSSRFVIPHLAASSRLTIFSVMDGRERSINSGTMLVCDLVEKNTLTRGASSDFSDCSTTTARRPDASLTSEPTG